MLMASRASGRAEGRSQLQPFSPQVNGSSVQAGTQLRSALQVREDRSSDAARGMRRNSCVLTPAQLFATPRGVRTLETSDSDSERMVMAARRL